MYRISSKVYQKPRKVYQISPKVYQHRPKVYHLTQKVYQPRFVIHKPGVIKQLNIDNDCVRFRFLCSLVTGKKCSRNPPKSARNQPKSAQARWLSWLAEQQLPAAAPSSSSQQQFPAAAPSSNSQQQLLNNHKKETGAGQQQHPKSTKCYKSNFSTLGVSAETATFNKITTFHTLFLSFWLCFFLAWHGTRGSTFLKSSTPASSSSSSQQQPAASSSLRFRI